MTLNYDKIARNQNVQIKNAASYFKKHQAGWRTCNTLKPVQKYEKLYFFKWLATKSCQNIYFYIENQQFEAWNKNNLGLYG